MAQEPVNPFILRKIFPDANSILKSSSTSEQGYKDYLFVLDTNTLLAPYSIGRESTEKIKTIYSDLISKNSLYIPVHAILEFAKNRSNKISEIFTSVDNALANIPTLPKLDYPILYNLDSHKQLAEFKEAFKESTKKYKSLIQEIHNNISGWNWQDPVTKIYSDIFKDEIFIDMPDTEENLMKELQFRFDNNIPPGFKDKGKIENSIGDLLIWKSILKLGKDKSSNVIFVTNDEKSDWFVRGNSKAIVTRFELVNEYYRYTDGRNFACMNFSSFLELQGAESKIVDEIQVVAQRNVSDRELILESTSDFEKQLLSAPDAVARLNIAFEHFNIYRGAYRPQEMGGGSYDIPYQNASGPRDGIRRLMAPNFAPIIFSIIKSYNDQHALDWNFTPADLLAVEIRLLMHTGILATISYGYSPANGPGPWKSSPLPTEIQTAIAQGQQGRYNLPN